MIIITMILIFVCSVLIWLYVDNIKNSYKMFTYKQTIEEFRKSVDALIDYYLYYRGTYDVLIQNTSLNKKEYVKIMEQLSKFVAENIPTFIEKQCKKFMTHEQYAFFNTSSVEVVVSKIYTPDNNAETDDE